ncbi:DUF2971 domain-containing protein [Bacillus subtilis]|uniref:DUF2971 domain-containing protein n=1 Tax=Bacillus subtilis TaxID=1423 RepID=UPI000EF1E306|nr:DUF2971 domain-containing protein [Bacillus subtilis]AYK60068.1 DUF2971 domain-containing protein [Bacillus subtilis subsp. subtilis]MDI6546716.1 DUF2971 domain-containing protein [Bacillus subtilis]MEC1257671.1 DUF2971 domain-containing protein [Bacillus subtilis]MEC1311619.1 DUF2971 domain-containing protein [Bacillus subtilis]
MKLTDIQPKEIDTQNELRYLISKLKNKKKIKSLYHYTNIYGVEGILKHKELWLSDANFLNDKNELLYTYNLCKEAISDICGKDKGAFLDHFKDVIESEALKKPVYVMSLTTNSDSNLLWSNYTNNDGYNIILDHKDLFKESKIKNYHLLKFPVIYDNQIQKEIISELMCKFIGVMLYFQKFDKSNPNFITKWNYQFKVIALFVKILAIFFKDSCFSQEEEYRIALLPETWLTDYLDYTCRISNGSFIPYLTVPIHDKKAIKGLTIGPKNNMDIAKDGILKFLEINGYDHLDENSVNKSKIPYRY